MKDWIKILAKLDIIKIFNIFISISFRLYIELKSSCSLFLKLIVESFILIYFKFNKKLILKKILAISSFFRYYLNEITKKKIFNKKKNKIKNIFD